MKKTSSNYRLRGCFPIGLDVESTWSNLLAGKSGIAEIKQFDASAFPTHIAAEVKTLSLILH